MTETREHNGPTFKLVILRKKDQDAYQDITITLKTKVEEENILPLFDFAFLVYTEHEPMDIRDWLKSYFSMEEHLLVVQFERWSGFGESEAWKWLLWRGH